MPPSLSLLPFPSGPDPITPTVHLPHDITPSGKKLPSQQQELRQQQHQNQQSLASILEASRSHNWTAPWRAGLPTPPSDMMNEVAYNTFLPLPAATANSGSSSNNSYDGTYNGKRNGLSLHPYSRIPSSSFDPASSAASSSMAVSSSRPSSHVPKTVPSTEAVSQRKSTSNSIPSYLQIPSSISDSKGSLAEFAAQVRSPFWISCGIGVLWEREANWIFGKDDLLVLVREHPQIERH